MRAAYDFDDLTSFLVGYYEGMGVLVDEQDFYDLAMAYFRKAASQNVRLRRDLLRPAGAHDTRHRRSRPSSRDSTVRSRTRRPRSASGRS